MSNKNDDDFRFDDEDDLFRNDNFDNFEDSADIDDNLLDLGDDPIVLEDDDEQPERRGTSRTFVILAVILILLLIGGFAAILLSLGNDGGSPELNATRTSIAERNATTLAQLATIDAQGTQSVIETATAMSFTATPSPTFTPSPTNTPEIDLTGTFVAEATRLVINSQQTQQAIDANGTATQVALGIGGGGDDPTPTAEGGIINPADATGTALALDGGIVTPISIDAVNQTATALAQLFGPENQTAQASGNATNIAALPTATRTLPDGTGGGNPTELPNTGLFDELNAGSMGALAFVAFGLVGIIFAARRTRNGGK